MTTPDVSPTHPPSGAPKKILLLEDDYHFGEFLRKFLTMRGYTITLVLDGIDGVGEILQSDFDAIVCDFMMPKLSGDLFYRTVQRCNPRLCSRFIFISGNGHNPRVVNFIKESGRPLLQKPFHVNDLFRALNELEAE